MYFKFGNRMYEVLYFCDTNGEVSDRSWVGEFDTGNESLDRFNLEESKPLTLEDVEELLNEFDCYDNYSNEYWTYGRPLNGSDQEVINWVIDEVVTSYFGRQKVSTTDIDSVFENGNDNDIFDLCFDKYLWKLPKDEIINFVLRGDKKPTNMEDSVFTKVVNELGINPYELEYWDSSTLDKFINICYSNIKKLDEVVNLDDSVENINNQLLRTLSKDNCVSFEFEYDSEGGEYVTSYIIKGNDGKLHTLVYYDEQNGVQLDDWTIDELVNSYHEDN